MAQIFNVGHDYVMIQNFILHTFLYSKQSIYGSKVDIFEIYAICSKHSIDKIAIAFEPYARKLSSDQFNKAINIIYKLGIKWKTNK